ncbi:MAG: hypothetical protein K940chlam9_01460 [Chlamydiae bacterium]|nr:hypothetical protein [Chlamydiota bacterium]
MVLSRVIAILTLLSFPLLASFPEDRAAQMLFLLHKGEVEKAFTIYSEEVRESDTHDFTLLQEAGKQLLQKGVESRDPEVEVMCMFGAGISNSSSLLPVLVKGMGSKQEQIQLLALRFLGALHDDEADLLIQNALGSPSLLMRLEACLHLAQKNYPDILNQLQSLMYKVPPQIRAVFPQIAIHIEGGEAESYMRHLLTDKELSVRMEAILRVAKGKRDEFLPQIRKLATQPHHAEQEGCAFALGALKDSESIPLLRELAEKGRPTVRMAALHALYELNSSFSLSWLKQEALCGDLFALQTLAKMEGEGNEIFAKLLDSEDREVHFQALLALLKRRDKRAIAHIESLLFLDKQDLGFYQVSSPGGTIKVWKCLPSAHASAKKYPGILAQTTALREKALLACLEISEKRFYPLCRRLLFSGERSLVPLIVKLLENKQSEEALALLREGTQKTGAPYARNYCALALYRLREEGPYEEMITRWIRLAGGETLIQFKEGEASELLSPKFALSPSETSRFLVESYETLASIQSPAALDTLLYAMVHGNPKNRYALAGLLIRITE